MALRPEIFIAAAAPEMNGFRKVVRHALLELGAAPVEQADLSIEYAPLHGILMETLGKCQAVIHLAGRQFGPEPAERTLHAPRRSYTHYELDIAQKLTLPIFSFTPAATLPGQDYPPEDDEARELQEDLRAAYLRPGQAKTFATPEELVRLVRELRSQIIVRQSLARLPSRPMAERFIGRHRLLEDLRQHLQPGTVHLLQPSQGLAPLGGAGTSTLAVELAWRTHDAGEKDFVFWLPAGAGADFEASLAALARTDSLSLLPDEVVSHRTRLDAVFAWLQDESHRGRFLVVVDGVETETAWWSLKSFLPRFALGSVVLTGRPHPWPHLLTHTVAAFSAEQAREFLTGRVEKLRQPPPGEWPALEKLGEALGRVPLALETVAGLLRETECSGRDLLARLSAGRESATLRVELSDLFQLVERSLDEPSRALLRLLICLAPEPAAIPIGLFEGRGDWPLTSLALTALERRALILRDESSRTIRVHRAVRQLARDCLDSEQITEGLHAARAAVDAALVRAAASPYAPLVAELRELLIPHCRALLGQMNGLKMEIHATTLARGLADWLDDCGRPADAEVFYRRALATEERRLGSAHAELSPRLRDLAGVLRRRRKLPEAESLYRRALAITEGPQGDPAELSADQQNLALCLRAMDRLPEAEALCRRIVEAEERQFGSTHARVAISLHRLAGVVEAAGRLPEAESLYRRALTIDEASFGPGHPRIPVRLYHAAASLARTRRRADAEELYLRGLHQEEKRLGRDHLDLAPVLGELAALFEDLGRTADAEPLYRHTVQIYELHLGPTHLESALASANFAAFLHEQQRSAEALPLYAAAAETLIREARRLRGPSPHLPSLLKSYAAALRATGEPDAAIRRRLDELQQSAPRREASKLLVDQI